jgi:transcriptional regulator with XRE-family HTH domain
MKPEERNGLGSVLRKHLKALNYTQERLAGVAGIHSRTVQRAVSGKGINKENLSAIANALGLDERQILKEAAGASTPPPDKRISLQLVRNGSDLVEVIELCQKRKWSLEVGPMDEHRYNAMVGEDIGILAEDLTEPAASEKERVARVRHAQGIISLSQQLGFRLFAGNYTEDILAGKRQRKRKTTLIIAAPARDPRIIRTVKGPALDVVRDSRHLPIGAAFTGHGTAYDFYEDQLLSKSDGEFYVKNEFRRIMREVMAEMNQAGKQERKSKR